MSGEPSSWRRGGDPANPPIDRVGVWQRSITGNEYLVESLDPEAWPKWRCSSSSLWKNSAASLGDWQNKETGEWRYVGPIEPDAEPSSKGDREAFIQSYRLAEGPQWSYVVWDDRHFDFLCSPAGRAEVLKLWGEQPIGREKMFRESAEAERDRLASQLEEARAECERLKAQASKRDEAEREDCRLFFELAAALGINEENASWDSCREAIGGLKRVIQEVADITSNAGFFREDELEENVRNMASECLARKDRIREMVTAEAYRAIQAKFLEAQEQVIQLRSRLSASAQSEGETETLRDKFAMAALCGMLGADGNTGPRHVSIDPMQQQGDGKWLDPIGVSRQSYEISDAMLKARESRHV